MENKYMHTINGCPATCIKDEQLVYCNKIEKANLCNSLYQIRKEQRLSNKWRVKNDKGL